MRRSVPLSLTLCLGLIASASASHAQADGFIGTPVVVPQMVTVATTSTNGQFSASFPRPLPNGGAIASPVGGSTAPQVAQCSVDSVATPTTTPVVTGHCSVSAPAQAIGSSGETAIGSGIPVNVFGY